MFRGHLERIPDGDAGAYRTLVTMRRLVASSIEDPRVVSWAQDIVRWIPERDTDAEAAAILAWVRASCRYTGDPNLDRVYDLIKSPVAQLTEYGARGNITADCDDQVVLLAAGLEAVGIETRMVAVETDQSHGGQFSHVLLEYLGPHGWTPVDPIVRQAGPGWIPPHRRRLTVGATGNDGVFRGWLFGLAVATWIWGACGRSRRIRTKRKRGR